MVIQKNSAKAIIVDGNKVLLLKKVYEDGSTIYTLPGGTQELGEHLDKTIIREVYEEIGARVSIVDLVNVYEHQRQSRKDPTVTRHKLEFAFLCRLAEPYEPHNGEAPDPHQVAVEWISLTDLTQIVLNPSQLGKVITELNLSKQSVYLGDMG